FLGAGLLLTAAAALPAIAVPAAWLAQPLIALGVRQWRAAPVAAAGLRRDLPALVLLWALAMGATALLVGWPLSALMASGGASLGAALALSATAGLGVIALWRLWPLWHVAEREGGGTLAAHWRTLDERDGSSWGGLRVALAIAAILALGLALGWPGLVAGSARWLLVAVAAIAWPGLHWALQRAAPPAAVALDVV